MKFGKHILFTLFTSLLFSACVQQVFLKKSPSEIVLTSIKSEGQKTVSYSFNSKIPEVFKLQDFEFDINDTYKSNLKIFMSTKYNLSEKMEDVNIEYSLISCNQTVKSTNSGMQDASNILNALTGSKSKNYQNMLITTEISLKVTVKKLNQTISEKTIFTTDEYNGESNSVYTAQGSFDQAIGKSIIMIDKFLSSVQF